MMQAATPLAAVLLCLATVLPRASADDVKQTELYARIKSSLDKVRAIDTHNHPDDRGHKLFAEELMKCFESAAAR